MRPGAGSGELTPSQAVRLVEQAGQAEPADQPRPYAPPTPAPAPQPVAATPNPDPAPAPAPAPVAPPAAPRAARHARARRSWWARLRSRLRR